MFKNFVELETMLIRKKMKMKRLVLVNAHEEASLLSVVELAQRGYIEAILVGNTEEIQAILEKNNIKENYQIIDAKSDQEAAFKAVELVRNDGADILMKGFIQTSDLLKEVVNRETGIRKQAVLSHIALVEIPYLERLFMITDGGMLTYPTYEQKKGIIFNAIKVSTALDIKEPKIALLDAAEHTNPRIPSSQESEWLSKEAWENDVIVEGPISIDIAVSKDIADKKSYPGKIKGDADVLVVPDIISGNILGKVGTLFTDGKMAGIIEGAKVPIVLTSRGSSKEEKENSILLACYIAEGSV